MERPPMGKIGVTDDVIFFGTSLATTFPKIVKNTNFYRIFQTFSKFSLSFPKLLCFSTKRAKF